MFLYKDDIKNHFFIQGTNDTIITLKYIVNFYSNSMQTFHDKKFQTQLEAFTKNNKKADAYRRSIEWQITEMINLAKLINENSSESYADKEIQEISKENAIYAGVGFANISFEIQSDHRFWGKYEYTKANSSDYMGGEDYKIWLCNFG
jgi:hypothetical protein